MRGLIGLIDTLKNRSNEIIDATDARLVDVIEAKECLAMWEDTILLFESKQLPGQDDSTDGLAESWYYYRSALQAKLKEAEEVEERVRSRRASKIEEIRSRRNSVSSEKAGSSSVSPARSVVESDTAVTFQPIVTGDDHGVQGHSIHQDDNGKSEDEVPMPQLVDGSPSKREAVPYMTQAPHTDGREAQTVDSNYDLGDLTGDHKEEEKGQDDEGLRDSLDSVLRPLPHRKAEQEQVNDEEGESPSTIASVALPSSSSSPMRNAPENSSEHHDQVAANKVDAISDTLVSSAIIEGTRPSHDEKDGSAPDSKESSHHRHEKDAAPSTPQPVAVGVPCDEPVASLADTKLPAPETPRVLPPPAAADDKPSSKPSSREVSPRPTQLPKPQSRPSSRPRSTVASPAATLAKEHQATAPSDHSVKEGNPSAEEKERSNT
jgi:hypothetical protein